ncbi:MAG: alpha/beta hydrolase [Gemmatimonadetes bacterium]|nr:alpha/beta hydrolase [Gemmatimonadota bacterium]
MRRRLSPTSGFGAVVAMAGVGFAPMLASAQVPMPVSFESVQALPRRAPDREYPYGDSPSQRVRVWLAGSPTAPAPVVVLLHGGCWLSQYGVDHIEPLASALASEGFAVWAPEYRRIGEPGGGWPGTLEDVASAIDLLRSEDTGLDLERVVFVGHSAGGHLALWAAARGAFDPTHPQYRAAPLVPRGVIGLASITDLAAYAALGSGCPTMVAQLLGGTPDTQAARYLAASPAALPHPVPVVLIQGARDAIVPPSQARALPWARVRLVEGAEHFDVIHPGTVAFPMLLEELRSLTSARPSGGSPSAPPPR